MDDCTNTANAGARAHSAMTTPPAPSIWRSPASGRFETDSTGTAPLITGADVLRISPDLDIWDAWPVQQADGHPADLGDGSTLWMALGAPRFDDPEQRHGHARIHLLHRTPGGWSDLGPAMPDGFSPGSREWSGSAVLDPDTDIVTLYFTAAGRRGEVKPSFAQRIFRARADLLRRPVPELAKWRELNEIVVRDAAHYMDSEGGEGAIGTIKAFRDPAYFIDPADGRSHLLFAASAANSSSRYNGVVAIATASDNRLDLWQIAPPIISADGLNNELERPHALFRDGLYYVFWSTQTHVFDPAGVQGPTGLYGMVAERLRGPWRALNRTGLVLANPPEAPAQAYSWLVMPSMKVTSFVDDWGAGEGERRFGATFAPELTLELDGDSARLVTHAWDDNGDIAR